MKKRLLLTLAVSSLLFSSLNVVTSCETNNPGQTTKKDWYGEGAPDASLGKEGDTYTDTLTNDTYVKVNGNWEKKSTSTAYQGAGTPNNAVGKEGDTFLDTTTGDEYEKRGDVWVLVKEGNLIEKHLVTFDLNGGSLNGLTILDPVKVKHGEWVDNPGLPTKKNATFVGWYDGNFEWNFHSPVNGDLTLVAKYNAVESAKVTLTVDPNNGLDPYTWEGMEGDYPKLKVPTKEGYEFVGWYFEDTDEQFIGIVNSGDNNRTLVAKFIKANFNFKFKLKEDNTIAITGINNINSVSVVVPDEIGGYVVSEIAENAFGSRIYLETVSFGPNIKVCSPKAFLGCRALRSINVTGGSLNYKSVDGVLYNALQTELVFVPQKYCPGTSFSVPAGVTKIGDYAFYGQGLDGVTEVTLPDGLVEIGNKSFYECVNFTRMTMPSSLRKIGDYAFCAYDTANQIVLTLNDGLEFIGDAAFAGLYIKGEFKLPNTVKHIGARALANCTAITKFEFPRDLETLGENPLSNCTGVLEITLASGNTHFALYDGVLYTSDYKTLVLCPSGRTEPVEVKEGCTLIGPYAFYEVDNLGGITIPSTVTEFGESAFEDCYHIREFVIPDSVTKIGESCFDDCEDLTSITFGSGITSISKYAFYNCGKLSEINIPSNILTIEDFAFSMCNSLTKITFNEGLKSIGTCAFTYIFIDEYASDPGSKLKNLKFPDSLEYISDDAFSGHSGIITLTIGKGLKNFPCYQFNDCDIKTIIIKDSPYLQNQDGLILSKDGQTLYYATSLVSGNVEIPNGVKTIEEFAFYKSSRLRSLLKEDGFETTSVSFPSSVETIKEGAFTYTNVGSVAFGSGLRTIENHAFYSATFDGLSFGEGVETIEDDAFTFAEGFTSIVFPKSLKTIGTSAFCLTKLNSVKFSEGLETIGDEAFKQTKIGGVIKLPSTLKNFGGNVFNGGYANTQYIENYEVASGNQYLVSENGILMDANKTKVLAYAAGYKADGTNYQTSITLPSTIKSIEKYGLSYAPYLTEIVLNDGLENISDYAFENTGNLKNLIIPMSVTYVGYRAFNGWKLGSSLTFKCSEAYAGLHFSQDYLNGVSTSFTTVKYNG